MKHIEYWRIIVATYRHKLSDEQKECYQAIFAYLSDGMTTEQDLKLMFVDSGMYTREMFAFTLDELLGKNWSLEPKLGRQGMVKNFSEEKIVKIVKKRYDGSSERYYKLINGK